MTPVQIHAREDHSRNTKLIVFSGSTCARFLATIVLSVITGAERTMNWLVSILGQSGILIPEYGAWDAREDPRLHGGAERFAYKGTRRRLGYFPLPTC